MTHPRTLRRRHADPAAIAGPTREGLDSGIGVDRLLATALRYAARPDEWPLEPRFTPHRRWYYRLAEQPDAEIWLLSWLPNQHTDLHDHGGSDGAFVVVFGTLAEEHVSTERDGTSHLEPRTLSAGHGRSFSANYIHQITNVGSRPAVSVHVYSPALHVMRRYALDRGELVLTADDRLDAGS